MISNQKPTGRASGMATGLILGLLGALSVTLIGAAVFAKLISQAYLQESAMGYISGAILVLSSGVGAWVSAKRIKRQRMLVCLLSALCYLLVLVSCTALFFGGRYAGLWVTALAVLGTGCAVGFLGLREPGKRRKKGIGKLHKKYVH